MLNQLQNQEFARQIFKAWDAQDKGYLTAQEFTEQLVGLGLASDSQFIQRLLLQLTGRPYDERKFESVDLITLKDFLNVFDYDKFGSKACEVIKKEFKAKLQQQAGMQKGVV